MLRMFVNTTLNITSIGTNDTISESIYQKVIEIISLLNTIQETINYHDNHNEKNTGNTVNILIISIVPIVMLGCCCLFLLN